MIDKNELDVTCSMNREKIIDITYVMSEKDESLQKLLEYIFSQVIKEQKNIEDLSYCLS